MPSNKLDLPQFTYLAIGNAIRVREYHRGRQWFWRILDHFETTIAVSGVGYSNRPKAREAGKAARDEYVRLTNERIAKRKARTGMGRGAEPIDGGTS